MTGHINAVTCCDVLCQWDMEPSDPEVMQQFQVMQSLNVTRTLFQSLLEQKWEYKETLTEAGITKKCPVLGSAQPPLTSVKTPAFAEAEGSIPHSETMSQHPVWRQCSTQSPPAWSWERLGKALPSGKNYVMFEGRALYTIQRRLSEAHRGHVASVSLRKSPGCDWKTSPVASGHPSLSSPGSYVPLGHVRQCYTCL